MIKTNQSQYSNNQWEQFNSRVISPQISLIFGNRSVIETEGAKAVKGLKDKYPLSTVVTVSTAGNIIGNEIKLDNLTATCIEFEKTSVKVESFKRNETQEYDLGNRITEKFDTENLSLVLVFTTMNINAGELINGVNNGFNNKVLVSGGVAGDGTLFEKTILGVDEDLSEDSIVVIGFYSKDLKVSHGSKGGWIPIGPSRLVTKAENNVLFEIDNLPVLDLYKEYLGSKAKDLPGSGLLFPFAIIDEATNELVIRGIQGVDEISKSIILYGNIETGQKLRLMRANHSVLIDGAAESANDALRDLKGASPQLLILVSCVARFLAMDQLAEEEVIEVSDTFEDDTTICGFYSYSEFAPLKGALSCSLHNQTMTITALSEK